MPSATTSSGEPDSGLPSKRTSPANGTSTREIVLSVVLLPAPLAPSSATISPAATSSEMPRSASISP